MLFNQAPDKVLTLAANISLLLLDVDGVLTDGKLYYSSSGEEIKTFSTLDGHGLKMIMRSGITVGIITGRKSPAVETRCNELGITILYQGQQDKLVALGEILEQQNLQPEQVAYAGDDLPDLPVIRGVGLGFSVPTAHPTVRIEVAAITEWPAGQGAVREICDYLLTAQKKGSDYLA